MNLLNEFLKKLLGEARTVRKAGDVWQTPSKKWSAKRADRTQGGFGSEEAARQWLAGTGAAPGEKKSGQTIPTGAEKPTQQPTPSKPDATTQAEKPQTDADLKYKKRKVSSTGATVYDNPIETPSGNKINVNFKPEDIKKITSFVDRIVASRAAKSDDLPTDISLDTHLRRRLPQSNDEYYKRRGIKNPQRIPTKLRKELQTAGVPDSHIDMLERAINTETDGDNPPFSEIAGSAVGMGKPPSQAGELVAMTLMALPRDQRGAAATTIKGLISATGIDSPTLDASWVDAGLNQAQAFDSMMDSRYGEGNWTVETTAWDTREDMDGIGLSQEDKGFSTDVALRIKLKNGEVKVARLSLKKNGEIYLLNGTTNDIMSFAFVGLPEEGQVAVRDVREIERLLPLVDKDPAAREQLAKLLGVDQKLSKAKLKDVAKARRKELEEAAIESIPDEKTRERVRTIKNFPERQHTSAIRLSQSIAGSEPASKGEVKQAAEENGWSETDAKLASSAHAVLRKLSPNADEETIRKALEKAGVKVRPQAKLRKALLFAAQLEATKNPDMKLLVEDHEMLSVECGNAAIDSIVDDPNVMKGLMLKLEETFPVRVIADGNESMCLGGVPVSRETCEAMFGTSNPEEIQRGLRIVTTEGPPPERILVYTSQAGGIEIPIATVRPRERGKGYRGLVALEFQATRQFECAAAEANIRAKQSNPVNDKIVEKCKKGKRGTK